MSSFNRSRPFCRSLDTFGIRGSAQPAAWKPRQESAFRTIDGTSMKKFANPAAVFTLFALLVAAGLSQNRQAAATQRSEWIKFNPVTTLTAASFAKPPAADLPWVRMNMPATADPEELAAESRDLHNHGIGGVEVGQGAFPNNEQLVALLRAANQVGIKISLSHGPTQYPAGYSIDDDHARKTLVAGKTIVNAGETFDGHVPPPTLTAGGRSGFGGLPQTKTSADDAGMNQGAVVIRASAAGTYTTALSNGQTVRSVIADVPPPINLTHVKWHLSAEEWQPANPYTATFGSEAAQTRKDRVELDLDGLKPWPEIPGGENAAGLGTYTTAFDLPATWTAANGAILSLGEVFDTFTVTVNGRAIPVDQIGGESDIGA